MSLEEIYNELHTTFKKEIFYPKIAHIFPQFAEIDPSTLLALAEFDDEEVGDALEILFLYSECELEGAEFDRIIEIVLPILNRIRMIV